MKSSQQLELEAEDSRRQLESTLDELRARLTPGQVVDQVFDYARDGKASAFFNNLGRQAVENPLPVALVGAGFAWLMLSNGRGATRVGDEVGVQPRSSGPSTGIVSSLAEASTSIADGAGEAADAVTEALDSAADAVSDTVHATGQTFRQSAAKAGETVRSTVGRLSDAVSAPRDGSHCSDDAADRMKTSRAKLSRQATDSAQSLVTFCKEQPLVLAGIGLALGAAMGAAFPATQAENNLFGAASADAKEKLAQVKERIAGSVSDAASVLSQAGASADQSIGSVTGNGSAPVPDADEKRAVT